MFQFAVFFTLTALVNSQSVLLAARDDDSSAATPYQFSYSAPAIGGGSTHEETGDEYGRKTGSYTVQNEDGSQRIVQYVADEDGFRASISTNEPGTANQNPADVTIQSSADEGKNLTIFFSKDEILIMAWKLTNRTTIDMLLGFFSQ
ncbi:unnamed protein product [Larinioides sclopetarius]|uniref:Cuticle protein 10.9-like n=1 Tax=Larinioides sclopetarius TaxID=280406 RepID=A0AAV2B065_9ARAC